MAAIECGRGHLYDPGIYAACPYCNSSQQAIHFGQTPVGEAGKTAPIRGIDEPVQAANSYTQAGNNLGVPVSNDGRTMPPKGYQTPKRVDDEGNKTIGMLKKSLGIDPVVGWLVCIEGKTKGKDYKLRGQINTIGRSSKMDICIEEDNTISSENHARLSYSEKNNRFNLIPAESKNIIYLNDIEVFSPTVLEAYDVIDFGQTKLLFIPLCSNVFDWNKGKSGGDGNAVVS